MSSRRMQRVEKMIKRMAGEVVLREIADPRMGFITITGVKISPDLRQAQVSVSILGSDAEINKAFAALKNAEHFVRSRVAPALTMKYSPDIVFVLDVGMKRAQHVSRILAELSPELEQAKNAAEPDENASGEDTTAESGVDESVTGEDSADDEPHDDDGVGDGGDGESMR